MHSANKKHKPGCRSPSSAGTTGQQSGAPATSISARTTGPSRSAGPGLPPASGEPAPTPKPSTCFFATPSMTSTRAAWRSKLICGTSGHSGQSRTWGRCVREYGGTTVSSVPATTATPSTTASSIRSGRPCANTWRTVSCPASVITPVLLASPDPCENKPCQAETGGSDGSFRPCLVSVLYAHRG